MALFTDVSFLLILLLSTAVYWKVLTRQRDRSLLLVLVSEAIYFYLNPVFGVFSLTLVVGLCVAAKYALNNPKSRAALCVVSVVTVLSVLFIVKYGFPAFADFFTEQSLVTLLIMPLGVSYLCFRSIQYMIDVYRGSITKVEPIKLLEFLFFIPLVPAGPIETYQRFHENRLSAFSSEQFVFGLKRIIVGYAKKFFLLETLFRSVLYDDVKYAVIQSGSGSAVANFKYVACSFLYAYIDLSAYSDIAIGLSALFGIKIMENFQAPLLKTNLGAFWNSWHVSLSSWCRNNVFFPVYGATRMPVIGMYSSMMVMGLWHYLSWNWLVWALYHGTGLAVYAKWVKLTRKSRLKAKLSSMFLYRTAMWGVTICFVTLGYAFVATPTIGKAFSVLGEILL